MQVSTAAKAKNTTWTEGPGPGATVRATDLITQHTQLDLHNPSAWVSFSGRHTVLLKETRGLFQLLVCVWCVYVCVYWSTQGVKSSSVAIKCDTAAKQSKQRTAWIWQPYRHNGEVTESLLPSCCLVGSAVQEANVLLFLGKPLTTGAGICDELFQSSYVFILPFQNLTYNSSS